MSCHFHVVLCDDVMSCHVMSCIVMYRHVMLLYCVCVVLVLLSCVSLCSVIFRKEQLRNIPESHTLNLDCHLPAPLKDQSQILCLTCSHQRECYEQRGPGEFKRFQERAIKYSGKRHYCNLSSS